MRDLRDLKMAAGSDHPDALGRASPFNVSAGSFTLGNFSVDQIAHLYNQHTIDTGQAFTASGIVYVHDQTGGQPWLVNALAALAIGGIDQATPPTDPIGEGRLEWARETLIRQRRAHFTSLSRRLDEPRVRRIIEPLLVEPDRIADLVAASFAGDIGNTFEDDLNLVRDLGLVARDGPLQIANRIYAELMPRMLGDRLEPLLDIQASDFVRTDGKLDFSGLMEGFVQFWMANGGGYVAREFAAGTGSGDLLIRWPYRSESGERRLQHEVLEIKVHTDRARAPLEAGLVQLDRYCARYGLKHGTLVIFDKRSGAPPIDQRTRTDVTTSPGGRLITVIHA